MSGNYPKRPYSEPGNYQGRYRGRNDQYSQYRRDYRDGDRGYRERERHERVRKDYRDEGQRAESGDHYREREERDHGEREYRREYPRDRGWEPTHSTHREPAHREPAHREPRETLREPRDSHRDRDARDTQREREAREREKEAKVAKERRAPERDPRDISSPWAAILRVDSKTGARLSASAAELASLNRRLAQAQAERMRLAGAVGTLEVYAGRDALNAAICAEKLDEFVYM